MKIPNRYVMYTLYIDGDVTEAEYNRTRRERKTIFREIPRNSK